MLRFHNLRLWLYLSLMIKAIFTYNIYLEKELTPGVGSFLFCTMA